MAHRNDDAPLSVEEKRARLAGGRGLASHPAQSGGVREDGGGAEGVRLLTEKLKAELSDAMAMCGVHSLSQITHALVF